MGEIKMKEYNAYQKETGFEQKRTGFVLRAGVH